MDQTTTINDPIQTMVQALGRIRDLYGEDKYRFAAVHSARMILAQNPELREDLKAALSDIHDGSRWVLTPSKFFYRALECCGYVLRPLVSCGDTCEADGRTTRVFSAPSFISAALGYTTGPLSSP